MTYLGVVKVSLSLPRTAFESIMKHLVKVEEEKEYVLDACYPKPCEERERVREMLNGYILSMNDLIGKIKVHEQAKPGSAGSDGIPENVLLPFVMVGSEVSVVELEQGEKQSYRVQHPFKTDGSGEEISYISPLGAALLLKKPGQELAIDIPAGKLLYRIESIQLIVEPDPVLA